MASRRGKWSIQKLIGLTPDPDPAATLAASGDDDVRIRAARDLGERGDERAAGPLIEALVTEHGPVAAAAAAALVRLDERGHEITPKALLDVIDQIQWNQLRGVYRTADGRESHVPYEVARSVIGLMRRRATIEHIPVLIESWRRLPRPESSKRPYIIVEVLAGLDDPAGLRALAAELRRTWWDPGERKCVLDALCPAGRAVTPSGELLRIRPLVRPGQADVLLELFTDPSLLLPESTETSDHLLDAVPMRARVARALGILGERRAIQPLLDWLDEIRAAVGNLSLEPPQRNEHGHLVGNSLERVFKGAQQDIATGLGEIGGPEVVEAMLARMPDQTAVAVLGDCGDTRVVPALVTCLQEHGWASAADVLGKFGDRRAVPALCARLKKVTNGYEDNSLQVHLAKALARIGDRSALPALRAIDPGPVTSSDWAMARDDATFSMHLKNREEIRQAVAALQTRKG